MVKNLLNHCALSLTIGAMALFGADAATARTAAKPEANPLAKFAYKHKATPAEKMLAERHFNQVGVKPLRAAAAGEYTPDMEFTSDSGFGYLDGPDGSTWYYILKIEADEIFHPYGGGLQGGWTESIYKEWAVDIFDSHFQKVGSIKDEIHYGEDESKIASLQVSEVVTQRFFNTDDKYEIMLYTARNPKVGYGAISVTEIYQIGGETDEKGYTAPIARYDGMMVQAANIAPSGEEHFYITMAENYEPDPEDFTDPIEFANAQAMQLKIYKPAAGSTTPSIVHEHFVRLNCMPGDLESYPCLFTIKGASNGSFIQPYFVFVEYEKPFWINPLGWNPDDVLGGEFDERPTQDNNLVITTYALDSQSSSQVTEVSKTFIQAEQPEEYYATYYSIGGLDWDSDIIMGENSLPEQFIVLKQRELNGKGTTTTNFYKYDAQGNQTATLAENVDAFRIMSDVPNRERQVLFVFLEDNSYYFSFTNITSGEEVLSFPSKYQGYNLQFSIDRVKLNGKVLYAVETLDYKNDEEFNALAEVVWIDEAGNIDHADYYNIGEDVAYAQSYLYAEGLNPHLFDDDDEMEMMFLVKRYIDLENGSSTTREELMIVGAESGPMFTLVPDDTKGALSQISLVNLKSSPELCIFWYNQATETYSTDFYLLPLHFEKYISLTADNFEVSCDERFNIALKLHNYGEIDAEKLLSDLSYRTDDSMLEMTGNYTLAKNLLTLEFKALRSGETPLTISLHDSEVTCNVNIFPNAGVEGIAGATAPTLSYAEGTLTCPDTTINLYSASGLLVATGHSTLSTTNLPAGIYVAETAQQKLKITVK